MKNEVPMLLNVREVAEHLRISPHTVRKWLYEGKIKAIRLGRRVLFHPEDVSLLVNKARLGKSNPQSDRNEKHL